MNYDAEIAKLVDLYSEKLSRVTGKPEHRKQAARRMLLELTEATKKLVREKTLLHYEAKAPATPAALGPLFQPAQPHVPPQIPGAVPPVMGGVQPTSRPQS